MSLVNWIWERVKSTYPCLSAILFFFLSWLRLQKNKQTNKQMTPSTLSWKDDEVELLLKVTNEYKVSKTAENVDWESVQKKYCGILDWYKDELEKASGSGKDYPQKGEEITKQCLTNKLKSIRLRLLFSCVVLRLTNNTKSRPPVFLQRPEVACSLLSFRWTVLIHHTTCKNCLCPF